MELRREKYIKEEVDQDKKESHYNRHFFGGPDTGIMHYDAGKSQWQGFIQWKAPWGSSKASE